LANFYHVLNEGSAVRCLEYILFMYFENDQMEKFDEYGKIVIEFVF